MKVFFQDSHFRYDGIQITETNSPELAGSLG